MKLHLSPRIFLSALPVIFTVSAHAATYDLTVTNGGQMPISASVIYVLDGQTPLQKVGDPATTGFIALCEKGNAQARENELRKKPRVRAVARTMGHLDPGQSQTLSIEVQDPETQSLHFETMYGKTKEICGVIHTSGNDLVLMRGQERRGTDIVVESGAYAPPTVPMTGLEQSCANAKNATACLRSISPAQRMARVRAFSGYAPSVLSALEKKYGTAELQTLLVPSAGILHYNLNVR
jgi:hypothetical protein